MKASIFLIILIIAIEISCFSADKIKFISQSRKILVLFDSKEDSSQREDRSLFHENFEFPLNRVGLVAQYFDINKRPFPDITKYRGIFIWFTDKKMNKPNEVLKYIINSSKKGKKIVCINTIDILIDENSNEVNKDLIIKLENIFGIKKLNNEQNVNPFTMKIVDNKKEYFHYETDFPPKIMSYIRYRKTDDNTKILRYIQDGTNNNEKYPVITVNSKGAWVLNSSFIFRVKTRPEYQLFWDMDPIKFLKDAFDVKKMIVPDTTTAFGLREAFSHIDGDAMENVPFDLPGKRKSCAHVVYEEILKKYPYPVSVSFIIGTIDPKAIGNEKRVEIAKKIFLLKNVQAASHAYSHPMSWEKGIVGIDIPGYTFNDRDEIDLSINYINNVLCPKGKKAEIFLWTGNCVPAEKTLAYIDQEHLAAINGGDAVYDEFHPSLTNICSLTRPVGKQLQVYACARNDYIYANEWKSNFGGFANVIKTFERSAKLRLLPVNVYYHFYIGERTASLLSMRKVMNWCRIHDLCWIHAKDYYYIVRGFVSADYGKTSDNGYYIKNFGELKTVRIDNCSKKVDMKKSSNITGFNYFNNSLYIGIKGKKAIIYLTDKDSNIINVLESTAYLKDIKQTVNSWKAKGRWYNKGYIKLQGFKFKDKLKLIIDNKEYETTISKKGYLKFNIPLSNGDWKELKVIKLN